ncbi:hypothetical protein QEN19_003775 [Hanseniaspora menglaensis]
MDANKQLSDNSERTHKTNIKMKRRLSFHHNTTITGNTLENALNEYSSHAIPSLDTYGIPTNDNIPQQTLNDNLVLSYLSQENFNYNTILNKILLNKSRSKTETLSMFTTIIEQLESRVKEENKKLNQELSDSILQSSISQILAVFKETKDMSAEFQRLDKKFQSLSAYINNKTYSNSTSATTPSSRNASKRLSSINTNGGQRLNSMISLSSMPQTPRLMSNSSSPDLWDNYAGNNTRKYSAGLRNASNSSIDISDKGLLDTYDLLLQRKQFDKLFELVFHNREESGLVLKYEIIAKNKISVELSSNNEFGNPVNDDLLLKKYMSQLKQLDSNLDLHDLFFTNRKNKFYNSVISNNSSDITKILLILEYIAQTIKLYNEIFISGTKSIGLTMFVQEILTTEFLGNTSGINNERKYDDLIKSYFEKYDREYNLNLFYIFDDFKNRNQSEEFDDINSSLSADYSYSNTNENSFDLSNEHNIL